MSSPFRFAVQGGPFGDPDALGEYARRVESLGYDELFSSDHLGGIDPFAPLLVAALATERLRVGPLVLNNEFHNPALLARTAASVDRLTDGRLVLGMGTGYAEAEHDAMGSPIRSPGPRVTRFGESLAALRALLDEGSVVFDGDHVHVDVTDLGVRPAQGRVPFLIGGHGRRVVRLAAAYADIFQFTGLTHGEDGKPTGSGFGISQIEERARWLDSDAGDRSSRIERSALVQVTAIDDDSTSIDEVAEHVGVDPDELALSPFVLIGSVEQIVDKLETLRERVGITHYVVRDPDGFAPVVAALAKGSGSDEVGA